MWGTATPGAIAARFWLACAEWGGVLSPREAADDARRAIALYTAVADRFGAFRSWKALAYVLTAVGRNDEALEALRQAIELRDPEWPEWILALFDNTAGIVYSHAGDLARARRHFMSLRHSSARIRPIDELNAISLLVELDVAEGIQRLAGYSGRLFGRLIDERDGLDAGMADDFLQLCAGVMYKDEPKYG